MSPLFRSMCLHKSIALPISETDLRAAARECAAYRARRTLPKRARRPRSLPLGQNTPLFIDISLLKRTLDHLEEYLVVEWNSSAVCSVIIPNHAAATNFN